MRTQAKSESFRNFQKGLGPILLVGRFFGTIPYSNVINWWRGRNRTLQFRWFSLPAAISCCLSTYTFIAVLSSFRGLYMQYSPKTNRPSILSVDGLASTSVAFSNFYTYYFILSRSKQFSQMIKSFMDSYSTLTTMDIEDGSFPWLGLCAPVLLLGTYAVENVLYDIQWFQIHGLDDGKSPLENFFLRYEGYFKDFIPYHPSTALVIVALSKMKQFLGCFREVLCILLCQALTVRFQGVNRFISERLAVQPQSVKGDKSVGDGSSITQIVQQPAKSGMFPSLDQPMWNSNLQPIPWETIRDDILSLHQLTKKVGEFCSPMMLCSYTFGIYVMVLQIFEWLDPNSKTTMEKSLYLYVSFVTYTLRVALVTYFASNVYHSSQEIGKTIQECPSSQFTKSTERLEKLVDGHPTGIALFGTFILTRKFFLSIISFVCTTEIVLLQTTQGRG